MTLIRSGPDAITNLRGRIGDRYFPPEPIPVAHHCIGIVRRNYTRLTGQNYPSANAAYAAVKAAGKLRTGPGFPGAVYIWTDNANGHIATIDRDTDYVLGNWGSTIQRVHKRSYSNLIARGWCWPWDIPGYGPVSDEIKRASLAVVPKPPVTGGGGMVKPGVPKDPRAKYTAHSPARRTIRKGSKGQAVKDLKWHFGYPNGSDVAGAKLMKMVDDFVDKYNRKHGTKKNPRPLGKSDGTCGPRTYRAITGH